MVSTISAGTVSAASSAKTNVKTYSDDLLGGGAFPVEIEVVVAWQGLPYFSRVGLAEVKTHEVWDRVSPLRACNCKLSPRHVAVSLAPDGQREAGTGHDILLTPEPLTSTGLMPEGKLEGYFSVRSCHRANHAEVKGQLTARHALEIAAQTAMELS